MRKLPKSKNAKVLARERYRMFLPYKNVVISITPDNGTEFYEHRRMA
jgi:IS30 family transposase